MPRKPRAPARPYRPPYLQVGGAARRLARQPDTLYRWRNRTRSDGRPWGPPCFQDDDGRWLYPLAELDEWAGVHGIPVHPNGDHAA